MASDERVRKVYDLFAGGGQIDLKNLTNISQYSKQTAKFLGALDANGEILN